MNIIICVIYIILLVLFVLGSLADIKANRKREQIEDEICRLQLGKKYYEELYGNGSWNNKKYK